MDRPHPGAWSAGSFWQVLAAALLLTPASVRALAQSGDATANGLARGSAPAPGSTAPELDRGSAWLNVAAPIHLRDLRGKVVVLEFWTSCCINCLQTLPELQRLQQKYPNQLVIIGIHSGKFAAEKDPESIRKAIARYHINYPVVNDSDLALWKVYGARGWPTLCLIDPEGRYVDQAAGEGHVAALERAIDDLIRRYGLRGTLNEGPAPFALVNGEQAEGPLSFPGKVTADEAAKRLFIADSMHHRIVITDLDGKKIAIAGSGRSGHADGAFARARFYEPQGLAVDGNTVYVADRKDHRIRALDLDTQTVRTIAGTGRQDRSLHPKGGPGLKTALASPWDLCRLGKTLYIAMAGRNQLWKLDLTNDLAVPLAGTSYEGLADGGAFEAAFAQPSGLATDGVNLYVADSETSAIRKVRLEENNKVVTLVGRGLFQFGDEDGAGSEVRLQHPLGLVWKDGKLYVADTYNNKVKILDPLHGSCATLVDGSSGWLAGAAFSQPGGIAATRTHLYVADTNAHRIRVVDLTSGKVSTLQLSGVDSP